MKKFVYFVMLILVVCPLINVKALSNNGLFTFFETDTEVNLVASIDSNELESSYNNNITIKMELYKLDTEYEDIHDLVVRIRIFDENGTMREHKYFEFDEHHTDNDYRLEYEGAHAEINETFQFDKTWRNSKIDFTVTIREGKSGWLDPEPIDAIENKIFFIVKNNIPEIFQDEETDTDPLVFPFLIFLSTLLAINKRRKKI